MYDGISLVIKRELLAKDDADIISRIIASSKPIYLGTQNNLSACRINEDFETSRKMVSDRAFETKLNINLSQIFNEYLGIKSIAETRQGRKRPDILIFSAGIKIIVEGSYTKQDAEDDVKAKIERGFADLGIALHYKEPIPDTTDTEVTERLRKSKFDAKIFTPKDLTSTLDYHIRGKKIASIPQSQWFETDILQLSSFLKTCYELLVKEEYLTDALNEIEQESEDFVNRLRSLDTNMNISQNLYDIFYRLNGLHFGDYRKIAELIYANAFLAMMLSIAFYQSVQPYVKKKNGRPLENLSDVLEKKGNKEGLKHSFELIQEIDYKPIYRIASEVVKCLPVSVFDSVIKLGTKLGSDQTLLKRDFSGRIYHKIVGDWSFRKGFATFFTTIPASYLLGYLAVFSKFNHSQSAEQTKICDFACGSGTLLTAAYSALEDLYKLEMFEEGGIDLDAFHKNMLENNIWGFDALRYALQIASLNLVFHNPSIALAKMNFRSIPLGLTEKGKVELGSLRFLEFDTLVRYFEVEDTAPRAALIDEEGDDTGGMLPKFDLIIMNPPFTRATGRDTKGDKTKGAKKEQTGLFGFLADESIRQKVLKEYNDLRKKVKESLVELARPHLGRFEDGSFSGIRHAGEGLVFLYLAYRYINDDGRIAFVIPRSILSGASWFLIRALLFEKFHIEYVVVSYDKEGGYNFSESTKFGEVLIVAKRVNEPVTEATKFIMLLKKPKTSFEAKALAKSIIANSANFIEVNGGAQAFIITASRSELKNNLDNWGKLVAFPNIKLLRFVKKLLAGECFGTEIPVTRLGQIATLGIDWQQYDKYFKKTDNKVSGSYPVVHGGAEEVKSRMAAQCNKFAVPLHELGEKTFKEKSSWLLVPDRIRVNVAHVISIFSSTKTLSNVFYAVRLNDSDNQYTHKALCAWLNSTFGLLLILSNRVETEGAWGRLKLSHWRLQNVLDITKLKKDAIEALSKTFDKYSTKDMPRLPQQYNPQNIDPMRIAFDKEVMGSLGITIDDAELKELYSIIYEGFEQWFTFNKARKASDEEDELDIDEDDE